MAVACVHKVNTVCVVPVFRGRVARNCTALCHIMREIDYLCVKKVVSISPYVIFVAKAIDFLP